MTAVLSANCAFRHRLAAPDDCPEIAALMDRSISDLLGPFLTSEQLLASREIMGIDSQLIRDGTYFIVQLDDRIAGCGGWSRRAKAFGGDQRQVDESRLLDPGLDAARVRAMYTHPAFARCGVGRKILSLCHAAAAEAGFRRAELVATLSGEPFYRACGYAEIERFEHVTSGGVAVPVVRMGMAIRP